MSTQQASAIGIGFDREAFLFAILIFIVEALIATVWSHHTLLRSFGGDVLAAVWVYFVLKTCIKAPVAILAIAAFAVGCGVEIAQFVTSEIGWRSDHAVLRIVLGSVADWRDVAAYGAGATLVAAFEWVRQRLTFS